MKKKRKRKKKRKKMRRRQPAFLCPPPTTTKKSQSLVPKNPFIEKYWDDIDWPPKGIWHDWPWYTIEKTTQWIVCQSIDQNNTLQFCQFCTLNSLSSKLVPSNIDRLIVLPAHKRVLLPPWGFPADVEGGAALVNTWGKHGNWDTPRKRKISC